MSNQTLAVLVNKNDPESVEIAAYYQQARLIPEKNIIYLDFKANSNSLTIPEFEKIKLELDKKVPENIQAYALAWRKPWRVDCMSITSAFSLGFSKAYCAAGCNVTKKLGYYNSKSKQPDTDLGIRPSMMLSGSSVERVKQLIDRGVAADYLRPEGTAYLLSSSDKQRNVRAAQYANIKNILGNLLNVEIIHADAIKHKQDVMFYFTGLATVNFIDTNNFLPGAIADHLTSAGGNLFASGQMSILNWLDAGATGSYGAVVEPCNFRQKFPDPQVVMRKYLTGDSLIEAYWKSVQMPGQGVFVGEPLASPYKGCQYQFNFQHGYSYRVQHANNYVERASKNCH